jgi:hypothetical protein
VDGAILSYQLLLSLFVQIAGSSSLRLERPRRFPHCLPQPAQPLI